MRYAISWMPILAIVYLLTGCSSTSAERHMSGWMGKSMPQFFHQNGPPDRTIEEGESTWYVYSANHGRAGIATLQIRTEDGKIVDWLDKPTEYSLRYVEVRRAPE